MYNYLFHPKRSRNRIEIVDDFPSNMEFVNSLQIHPMGWHALTRSISYTYDEEWTCSHDIQTRDPKDYEDSFVVIPPSVSQIEREEKTHQFFDNIQGAMPGDETVRTSSIYIRNMEQYDDSVLDIINGRIFERNLSIRYFKNFPEEKYKIIKNIPRLTHFIQEAPVGKNYLKEVCYSNDGRIICSPFENGIRLFAYNEDCQEVCYCVGDGRQDLHTIATLPNEHKQPVVGCKFNPVHYQMVSACLEGNIHWYKPIL